MKTKEMETRILKELALRGGRCYLSELEKIFASDVTVFDIALNNLEDLGTVVASTLSDKVVLKAS